MNGNRRRLFSFLLCFGALGIVWGDALFQQASARPSARGKFYGVPRIVDGDSLILDHEELRLLCLDAVELHQNCEDSQGNDYPCGVLAKKAMADLIEGRPVACYGPERDKYNRPLVHCRIGSMDLSEAMIAQGWAIATCKWTKPLAHAAKEKGLGIWQGKFLSPPTWRRRNPRPDTAAFPQQKTPWPLPSMQPQPAQDKK